MLYVPGLLALLYDIHGNLPALEATLEDARAQGARHYLLGGDYAVFGPWPAETVARLERLPDATWIRGNGERWTADPASAPDDEPARGALSACREALGADVVARLAGLPEQVILDGVRYCHASPPSDVRSFLPDPHPDDAELLAGAREPRLVFGHTHLPFARTAQGPDGPVELVNPGSVGMPFDGDTRAAYALVHDDARIEHRRVVYDHAASAAALRERYADEWAHIVAARLERARMSV
jgi:diadenosine tetraphosphatase ApaH/serine/threonine PP2A family protein phosphatase